MPKTPRFTRFAAAATVVACIAGADPVAAAVNPAGAGRGFLVACAFSHTAGDDPIVHPGEVAGSHNHTFFGATTTDANSTAASLLAGGTTCQDPADHSGYWIPTLLRGADPVTVVGARIAYAGGPGVAAPPAGLKIVAGGVTHAGFTCVTDRVGGGRPKPFAVAAAFPASCGAGTHLAAQIVFPDCWNGADLDSADHRSHLAYDEAGACPTGYGVKVAQLTMIVDFATGDTSGLSLSSGDAASLHADFMNGWVQNRLIRRLGGGSAGGPPAPAPRPRPGSGRPRP
jgi:hypothetical protein